MPGMIMDNYGLSVNLTAVIGADFLLYGRKMENLNFRLM